MVQPNGLIRTRRRALVIVLGVFIGLAPSTTWAEAGDLQDQLDKKRATLKATEREEGVRSSTLQKLDGRVDQLTGEVARLRNREANVETELAEVEARLAEAEGDLEVARARFQRAKRALRAQLVSIYKAPDTDAIAIILDASSYDDALGRATYLNAIRDEGEDLADRVRDLRDQMVTTVETIGRSRDEIAAREAELQRTREQLEIEEASLIAARDRQSAALARTRTRIGTMKEDVGDLERKIQAELQAAQAAAAAEPAVAGTGVASTSTSGSVSSAGLIWPINGTVTSPFGPRWGSIHAGLDIAAPGGTPIQAAAGGKVVMAGWNGGYGNYTCIDHGGGFSTCYAHQLSIGVTAGQDVSQGDVIGEVGNTGNSFGDHLHFETRVNGVPEDPLGYL